MNAASFFGRILPAGFAPRFGAMNMSTVFCISAGTTACFMYLLWSNAAFVIFSIIFGFTTGAAIALTPSMFGMSSFIFLPQNIASDDYRLATLSKDMNELGTRVGLNFALSGILGLFCTSSTPFLLSLSQLSFLIALLATPITGAILTDHYYWKNASLFSGVSHFYFLYHLCPDI